MPRRCSVCDSPALTAIHAALRAGKETNVEIAKRFGLSADALGRHVRNGHMAMMEDAEIEPLELTGEPREDAQRILEAAAALVNRAYKLASLDLQIKALDNTRKQLETVAKLLGQMPPDTAQPLMIIVDGNGQQRSQIESRPGGLLEAP
jgi:hypothetical protein